MFSSSLMSFLTSTRKRSCVSKMINASAASRNQDPILEVLKSVLPEFLPLSQPLKCLEIASGTGQHVVHFAPHLPNIRWQPTDVDAAYLKSIQAFKNEYHLCNVEEPAYLDVTEVAGHPLSKGFLGKCSPESFHLVYNSNMIHISPFSCTEGLFRNSGYLLKPGGLLITYGPYAFNGVLTPESNVMFDASLRASDPEWGVRDVELQLKPLAKKYGLTLNRVFDMPANNKTLIWVKDGGQ